ncbi:unnamed protein product, partial [Rotaria socialis]
EEEDEDEEEELDEEPASSIPKNDEINKLTEIITSNHLLISPTVDELNENENRLYKPFHDDNKGEPEENDKDDIQSVTSTS